MIRKATLEDLSNIQDLNFELFQMEKKAHRSMTNYNLDWSKGPLGTEYFKNSITDDRACTLVADEDGMVIGYLTGWIYLEQNPCRLFSKTAEIENMLVAEPYRSKGVGNELVKTFFAWAREKGVDHMKVCALAGNVRAIEFYRRCGFNDYETTLEMRLE